MPTGFQELRAGRGFVGRLETGSDLVEEIERTCEIVGFIGNVSLRDDRPFLHAHATFADASGGTVGGHLTRGCEVFMAEVMIREITGVTLVRTFDEATGLAIW